MMIDRAAGESSAAPRPWAARAANSAASLSAEAAHEERRGGGGEQSSSEAWARADREQRGLTVGGGSRNRRQGEHREPSQEYAPATNKVCEPAAQQQEAAEDDRVAGDRPRDRP